MSNINLTEYEKYLINDYKDYIQRGNWDAFFILIAEESPSFIVCRDIFQFCLENVPDLIHKIHDIPEGAYYDMVVDKLTIPKHINEIQFGAFNGAEIGTLIIEEISLIGEDAFSRASIGELEMPPTPISIRNAFDRETEIEKLYVPKEYKEEYREIVIDESGAKVGQILGYE